MAEVGTLSEEALKRKERLKAWKEKQHKKSDVKEGTNESEKEKLPGPMFRSYKPESDNLKDQSKPLAKPADVTEAIKDQLESGKTDHVITEVDLTNLAPRKPDWDLKRDISKKLEKLDKQTQRAIAELIRERLKASQEDLVSIVNVGEAISRAEANDDN